MSERPASGASFEDDVATALRTLPPDDLAAPGLVHRVPVLARRRRRLQVASALAGVTVAAVLGVVGIGALLGGGTGVRVVQPAVPSTPPPPVDASGPHLELDRAVAGPGDRVRFAVVNPGGTEFSVYGVGGTVDRWTATGWKPVGHFVSGTGDVPGGRLYVDAAASDGMSAPAVGLGAPAGGRGPEESVALVDVPPGWYRLGHEAYVGDASTDRPTVAYGVVEVRADVPAPTAS